MAAIDSISRLKSQLLTSGLQQKDQALFQVINQLIASIIAAQGETDGAIDAIISGINQLTGDVTAGPGSGSQVATLAASGVVAGTYGDSTHVAQPTVDAKGRVTAIANVAIAFPADTGITQLTGDVTAGPGSGSQAATIANDAVTTVKVLAKNITYAKIQDVSATKRILARVSGGSGVIEEATIDQILAFGNYAGILSGTGHPQGVVSAGIGNTYFDTNTGYQYRKIGGAATAYGWYLKPTLGAGARGPHLWTLFPAFFGSGNAFSTGSSHGTFALETANWGTGVSINSAARTMVSGNLFAQAQTTGVSGNTSSLSANTGVTTSLLLDGDVDITIELRTGSDVSNLRIWFGITSSIPTDTATLGSGSNGSIAFRYSTADGGDTTHWLGATQINGAGNQSLTSAFSTVNANQTYILRIRFIRSGTPTAYFSVDDGTEISLTTNIPATGSFYFPTFGWTTKTGAARVMMWRTWGAVVGS